MECLTVLGQNQEKPMTQTRENDQNPQFGPFWVHFGPEKFLFENRASSLLYLLMANLMQKKSEKSNGGKYEI